jgi:hypothetical protein
MIERPQMQRFHRLIALVTICTFNAACSVMQPHIDMPPPVNLPADASSAAQLTAEILRARDLQRTYVDQVSAETAAVNGLAALIIPLSASALAIGITNPGATFTRDFLLGAGLGAATFYALGNMTINRKRDVTYYAGAKAIYCERLAVFPVEIREPDLSQIEKDVESLRYWLGEAAASGASSSLIDSGNTLLNSGRTLVGDIRNAGAIFSADIDNINIAVNLQINATDPDVSTIMAAAGNLQKYASGFVPGFPAAKPAGITAQGTRGHALLPAATVEANLRRAIELVSQWIAATQDAVTKTNAKVQAAGCAAAAGANGAPITPTIIVTSGQAVTVASGPPGTPPLVITPTASGNPPPSAVPTIPPPPAVRQAGGTETDAKTGVTVTVVQFAQLAKTLGAPTGASSLTSPKFLVRVKNYQCLVNANPQDGHLTAQQIADILSLKGPVSDCPTAAASASAPIVSPTQPSVVPPPPAPQRP